MFTSEAFRDFAEAGNSKPPGDDAIKKDNKLEETMNLPKGPFLDEALNAQFRELLFRESNSTPLLL